MKLQLDKAFKERLRGRIAKYEFEVGVLEDGPHKLARRGAPGLKGADVISSYAGGPIRKKSRTGLRPHDRRRLGRQPRAPGLQLPDRSVQEAELGHHQIYEGFLRPRFRPY
jgi:hypothetical protein